MKEEQNYINRDTRWIIQFVFSFWMLYVGLADLTQRYFLGIEGVITASETTSGPRQVTYYQVLGSDKVVRQYIAGPTDKSLARGMVVGTRINKVSHQLWWEKNGARVDDFKLHGPLTITALAFTLMYWAVSQWQFRRKAKYRVPNQAL